VTLLASAKATSNRHLASSTGSGQGSGSGTSGGQAANPLSNTQKKKASDAKKKAVGDITAPVGVVAPRGERKAKANDGE